MVPLGSSVRDIIQLVIDEYQEKGGSPLLHKDVDVAFDEGAHRFRPLTKERKEMKVKAKPENKEEFKQKLGFSLTLSPKEVLASIGF